jgi:ATP-dependent DNA helicase RecG
VAHPYASLLGPLQYACQRDFAQLPKVKNLRAVIEAALAAPGEHPRADEVRALLSDVDSPVLERRKAAVARVHSIVVGVVTPVQPERRTAGPESKAQSVRGPASDAKFALAPSDSTRAPKDRSSGPSTPLRSAQGERGRKKAVGKTESRQEAKLLSIAPSSGPLAMPLKSAGGRLSPKLIAALNRKGLQKLGDVLFLLPRCYEDRRKLKTIAELIPGERGVTVATVRAAQDMPFRGRGRRGFRAVVGDATGSLALTFFQGGPWMKARFPVGKRLVISGEVRASPAGREIAHPEIEPADELESSSIHYGRIVPIYPGFERHEQRAFRELAHRVATQHAHHLAEPLPQTLRDRLELPPLVEALQRIHFPEPDSNLEELDAHQSAMHRRLAFDELFFLQLGMALKRRGVKVERGISFDTSPGRITQAKAALPFTLTRAQAKVVGEIARDMARPEPMNRLLQGDVGSGKTAVAMISALLALQDGYQVALMAPTEILASQHFRTLSRVIAPLGHEVGRFTAGGTPKERRDIRERLATGKIRIAVGTHALIQEDLAFAKLGLAIVDEQHRFGVIQRHALMSKGVRPDVLVMTATPIPRTLAMTLYGDLDVSVIDELPPGRTPIVTRAFSEKQRGRVYEAIARELGKGHQAYVVYPLVEESEKVDLTDATRGAQTIQSAFPDRRVGLLHGQLSDDEKSSAMEAFRKGELDILVCTTVVEVGVDVPNASVMVIEHAERFGLSQLHQLRGRVGRGAAESFCFLVSGYPRSQDAAERLAVMEKSSDGFVIAEKDLELRGPGEFLGTRQSGMPELAVANLVRDQDLLSIAQEEARQVVASDPRLQRPENVPLARALEERWEGRLSLARVG